MGEDPIFLDPVLVAPPPLRAKRTREEGEPFSPSQPVPGAICFSLIKTLLACLSSLFDRWEQEPGLRYQLSGITRRDRYH